ncbi:unnamed protein product, partial [Didymodactylos carnosus]
WGGEISSKENINMAAKRTLRQHIKKAISLMSVEERREQSSSVFQQLIKHPKFLSSHRLSIFISLPTEIATFDIIEQSFKMNKHVYIPRYDQNTMQMLRLMSMEDLDTLPMTKWNIKQPRMDDDERETASELDLILVPGLAFSLNGYRLGHGKGFYDKFLNHYVQTHNKKPFTIGLAFTQQIVDNLPVCDYDYILDEILTHKTTL